MKLNLFNILDEAPEVQVKEELRQSEKLQ